MTAWTVQLTNDRTATVEADEITTRVDGSLWCLAAINPKPNPLVPVLILARGQWIAAHPADADQLPAVLTPPERTPRTA